MCSSSENCSAKLNVKPKFPWFLMSENFKDGVSIICGDRKITVRPATGETGPEGPFPFIILTEKDRIKGFCVHSEDVFDKLWEILKELRARR